MCQYLRLRDNKVIEAMASGIPKILQALSQVGLPQAEFHDQGIRFTVLLRRHGRSVGTKLSRTDSLTAVEERLLAAIDRAARPISTSEIAADLRISGQAVRRTLASLRSMGALQTTPGDDGRTLRYRRNPGSFGLGKEGRSERRGLVHR